MALVTCGTRTVIDAVFGPMSCGELGYARRPRRSLHAGMIVLLDRNFGAAALIGELAATEADLLVRLKGNRELPVLRRYRDGSFLSRIGAVQATPVQALLVAQRCAALSGYDTDFVTIITVAYTGMRWSEVIGLGPSASKATA